MTEVASRITRSTARFSGPLVSYEPPAKCRFSIELAVNVSDEEYGRAVERAKEYIRAGDAFQVVPARTFSTEVGSADVLDVYRALRVLSPAPYMYLLEFPASDACAALAVAGASPETLARVENRERRAYLEQERPERPTYDERLDVGFRMLASQMEIF